MLRTLLSLAMVAGLLPAQQERWTIRGRVVADETGEPLAGATVTLTGHQATGYPLHWAWLDWFDPEPITTGADGVFAFPIQAQPGRGHDDGYPSRVHLVVTMPRRMGTYGHWYLSRCCVDPEQDTGDIRLQPGREVRMRVRDEDLHPLAARVVRLTPGPSPPSRGEWYWPMRWLDSEPSDPAGNATIVQPLGTGTCQVDVVGETVTRGATLTIDVGNGSPIVAEVVVKNSAGWAVSAGTIVDALGAPAGGRDFVAQWKRERTDQSLSFRTDAKGAFRIDRLPRDLPEFDVREVVDEYSREAIWRSCRVGDEAIRLEAAPRARLLIAVRLPPGVTAERFAVHAVPLRMAPGRRTVRTVALATGGQLTIDGLGAGTYSVRVHACGTALWPSAWTECDVPAKDPVVFRFEAPVERTLFVFTAEGRPVVDGRVDLVFAPAARVAGSRRPDSAEWRDPVYDRTMTGRSEAKTERMIVLADRGRTDRSGRVKLRGLAAEQGVCVRVRGGGATDTLVDLPSWPAASELLRITVPGAGEVRGVLSGGAEVRRAPVCSDGEVRGAEAQGPGPDPWEGSLDGLRRRAGSCVVLLRVGAARGHFDRCAVADDTGHFVFDSVEPGTWDVKIVDHERDKNGKVVEIDRVAVGMRIEVAAGEVREVELSPHTEQPTQR